MLPLRYGMGFMLGGKTLSLYGPDTKPRSAISASPTSSPGPTPSGRSAATLMTSGKPLIYPEIYYLHDLMWTIGTVCTKTKRRTARSRTRVRRRA